LIQLLNVGYYNKDNNNIISEMNANSNNDLYNLNVAISPATTTTINNDRFTLLSGSSIHMQGNNAIPTRNQEQPSHQYGTNNAAAAMLNNRSGLMTAGAAAGGGGGGAAAMSLNMTALNSHPPNDSSKDNASNNNDAAAASSAGVINNFHTLRASFASSNTSVTADDDATSEAYRRCSKESLASHESLSDMLNHNAAGTMDAAQQANLLNLLQRQQFQMGNLSVASNHPANNSVGAAVAMMASLQQQQQQGSGTASHRNSMTGSVGGGAGGSFNLGGGADMNSFMMNMNFMGAGQHGLDATNLNNNNSNNNTAINSNNSNNIQGSLLRIPPKKSKNKHKETFAMKLMNILSLKECQSSIRWMPNGRAFCIIDPKLLVEKVLPVYIKEAKYTSFVSSLMVITPYVLIGVCVVCFGCFICLKL
jgi:hypothetical protein